MKLQRVITLLLFVVVAVSLPAETPWSYSLAVSSIDYSWTDEATGNILQEQMIGLEIRGSEIVTPWGFYFGTYLSFAVPTFGWEIDTFDETVAYADSNYDFYTSFGIPFGYRWVLPRGRTGAYLGAGPSFQALFDFQDHLNGSGGLFLEFGIESLRSKGVGVSFGTRLIMGWGSFSTDGNSYTEEPVVTTTSIFLGLSWTGTRGS